VPTEDGEYLELRMRTERESLTAFFGERAKARVLLESVTESEWVARHPESLGHEVIVADPGYAPQGQDGHAGRTRALRRVPSGDLPSRAPVE
jgi:hypothetical protein